MKVAVFWVAALASMIRAIAMMMETARTFETLVNFYQTTRRYNPNSAHSWCFTHFPSERKGSYRIYTPEKY
jgi:hypothetical protein